MGTSTWHRSPETEEWRHVRELYAQANPSPRDVVARIVAALDGETRAGLADPAVATCLGTLVEGAQLVAAEGMPATLERLRGGREPAALQMAAGLRDRAQRLVAAQGLASRFGDLALDAVGATALALATRHSVDADVMVVPSAVAEANFLTSRATSDCTSSPPFIGHELDRASAISSPATSASSSAAPDFRPSAMPVASRMRWPRTAAIPGARST